MIADLKEHGYNSFPPDFLHNTAMAAWQKRGVHEGGTTIYFINLYKYDLSKWGLSSKWQLDLQFTRRDETWNLSMGVPESYSIEKLEEVVYEMWKNNNFEMYD